MKFSSPFPISLSDTPKTPIRGKTVRGEDGKNRIDPDSGELALDRFEDDPEEENAEMARLPEIAAMYNAAKAEKDKLREKEEGVASAAAQPVL